MRVVLDTDVPISGLLFSGGPPQRLFEARRGGAFDPVQSDVVLDELARIWRQLAPRLKQTPPDVDDLLHPRSEGVDLVDAAMDALAAHHYMSRQMLASEALRDDIRDILPGRAGCGRLCARGSRRAAGFASVRRKAVDRHGP